MGGHIQYIFTKYIGCAEQLINRDHEVPKGGYVREQLVPTRRVREGVRSQVRFPASPLVMHCIMES